jgi:ribonucleoside-diphosphate reductase alpha chain
MHLDDSACNLASLNLKKFLRSDGTYDIEKLVHVSRMVFTAMEILIDLAGYPSKKIAENSHRFRPLGLGYANLGATLMALGLPYDSERGRLFAGAATALIHFASYHQSAMMAKLVGAFEGYAENKDAFDNVMKMHYAEAEYQARAIHADASSTDLISQMWVAARNVGYEMAEAVSKYGARNAQTTVLAPTGTISFMMDCDTTGIEPDIALVKWKKLAGKGCEGYLQTVYGIGYKFVTG